ncbi:MAG: hypothetical protein AAB385_11355 [Planctomycetota bacterium]
MSLPTTIGGLPSTPAEGPPWSRRGNRASATEFARETVYDAAMTPAATTNGAIACPADARILAEQLLTVAGVVVWDLLVSPQHGRRFGGASRRAVVLPARSQASLTILAGACPGGNEVRRRDGSRPPRGPNL